MKIIGVTIAFYPEKEEIENNIQSYIDSVDCLIIWDNTPEILRSTDFPKYKGKVLIMGTAVNTGIGYALNAAAKFAIAEGYTWMLTMDQDSCFHNSDFFDLFAITQKNNLGLISPVHHPRRYNNKMTTPTAIDLIATSGNIINLKAWEEIGGFNEALFIDEVDHDFCLRLIEKGYQVLECKSILLNHKLGDIKKIKTLRGKTISISLHSPLRTYYIVRNSFYIFDRYKTVFRK